jgi:hypothetical protein|tara:strand:- start:321 stop:665 length:345 start_codon:yes stop_codon:yes gene_type:complete
MAIDRLNWDSSQGWLGTRPTQDIYRYTIVGDRVEETKEITVHEFTLGDVEDPDLYAAHPLMEWQNSKNGKWIMEHAVETPSWHRFADPVSYGYKYNIRAKLQGARLTEWLLRKH